MKTIVISGGTDGIGRGLAATYLNRGDNVVVIGRDAQKGQSFIEAANAAGAGDRASFVPADLSLISENKRVIEDVKANFPVVDALVLCARYYRSTRLETAEGFEYNFALLYLSRFLLSHGLVDVLEKADNPVIMNVGGPGADVGDIRWDDLGYTRGYSGVAAMMHAGGVANDMLGVAFAEKNGSGRTKYVLFNPGSTSSGFTGEYDAATFAQIEMMKKFGKPVERSIAPIIVRVDNPPAEPLSAFAEGAPVSLAHRNFDKGAAMRLYEVTEKLLSS